MLKDKRLEVPQEFYQGNDAFVTNSRLSCSTIELNMVVHAPALEHSAVVVISPLVSLMVYRPSQQPSIFVSQVKTLNKACAGAPLTRGYPDISSVNLFCA